MTAKDPSALEAAVERVREQLDRGPHALVALIFNDDLRLILDHVSSSADRIERLEAVIEEVTRDPWGLEVTRFVLNGIAAKDERGRDKFVALEDVQAAWTTRYDLFRAALDEQEGRA